MTGRPFEPGTAGWMVGRPANDKKAKAVWWCGPDDGVGYSMVRLQPRRRSPALVWPDADSAYAALRTVFADDSKIWAQGFRIVQVIGGVPDSLPITLRLCSKARCGRMEKNRGLCVYHWRILRAAERADEKAAA